MHPALEELLAELLRIGEESERVCNQVRVDFPVPASDFLEGLEYREARDRFDEVVSAFYQAHHEPFFKESRRRPEGLNAREQYKHLNGLIPGSVDEMAWDTLGIYFGSADLAFKIARTNVEGGIRSVLDTINRKYREHWIKSRSRSAIRRVLGERDSVIQGLKEEAAQVRAYKDRYRGILPSEFLEENDYLSTTKFEEVLLQHCRMIRGAKSFW